jgi:hypothetical protein
MGVLKARHNGRYIRIVRRAKGMDCPTGKYSQTVNIWIILWYGNECGKNKSNENFKTTITSKNYDRPKTTRECGIF